MRTPILIPASPFTHRCPAAATAALLLLLQLLLLLLPCIRCPRSCSLAGAVAAAACALTGPHPFAFVLVFSSVCGTTSACKTKISFKDCI